MRNGQSDTWFVTGDPESAAQALRYLRRLPGGGCEEEVLCVMEPVTADALQQLHEFDGFTIKSVDVVTEPAAAWGCCWQRHGSCPPRYPPRPRVRSDVITVYLHIQCMYT